SRVPVAAQRRAVVPVFGGISGATRTRWKSGSAGIDRIVASADDESKTAIRADLHRLRKGVIGGAQQTGLVFARLHPAVDRVVGAGAKRSRVERLARPVVQDDREAALAIALDLTHDERRVLDLERRPLVSHLE